jgi:hypothetical protein
MAHLTVWTDVHGLLHATHAWKHGDAPTFNEAFASALLYAETHPSTQYPRGSFVLNAASELAVGLQYVRDACLGAKLPQPSEQEHMVHGLHALLARIVAAHAAENPRP